MFDACVLLRPGEKIRLSAETSQSDGGNVTFADTCRFALLEPDLATWAGGFTEDVDVSGQDAGAGALRRCWYDLDTAAMALVPGTYLVGRFTLAVTGADGADRVLISLIQLVILAT